MEHANSRQSGWKLALKRAVDLSAASAGLVFGWPVLLGLAAAIRLTMGGPVLFVQPRVGKGGRIFNLFKFRTMRDANGPDGAPLPDAQRMTPVGQFIRSTSLDELPQLLNVLKGDVSLVGPRPLLVEYLPHYSAEQARRHDVMPGITGWVQVNGRNALEWKDKFALDTWYADHWSLTLDARILAMTVVRVLRRDGVSATGHVTAPVWRGNDTE